MNSVATLSGRNNNFNLLRMLAAWAVLFSHSYALTDGKGLSEPFRHHLGMSLGSIAVDVFFVISGFLVFGSLLRRQSARDFIKGRVYRVYPAVLVMVTLTVLVLGPAMTSLSVAEYFSDKQAFKYFYKNVTLLGGVTYKLPGVFAENPYPLAVNGSLWTLPVELKMYCYLLGLWVLAGLLSRFRLAAVKLAVVIIFAVALLYRVFEILQGDGQSEFARLLQMFFAGAAFQVLAMRIKLLWSVFLVVMACLSVSVLLHQQAFEIAFLLALPYAVLFLALRPAGRVRAYNRVGDYSYGTYLYAFPVQQSVAALIPGIGLWSMVGIASMVTLAFAVLSWHFVEKPALNRIGRPA